MKTIYILILLSASIFFGSCKKDPATPGGYDQELVDAVNSYRATKGLPALETNDFIWQIAHEHSQAMADGSIPFGHDGVTDRSERITRELGLGSVSENISWGKGTATEVVDSWLASTGHITNIEGNFELTGLSAVRAKDGNFYYTQIFYKKK